MHPEFTAIKKSLNQTQSIDGQDGRFVEKTSWTFVDVFDQCCLESSIWWLRWATDNEEATVMEGYWDEKCRVIHQLDKWKYDCNGQLARVGFIKCPATKFLSESLDYTSCSSGRK